MADNSAPWPRAMHVERYELTSLLEYLNTPDSKGMPRGTKGREDRKSLRAVMSQLGLYQMWKASQSGEKTSFKLPSVTMCNLSQEGVNYLLGVMTDMPISFSLGLIDFEERLEDLKTGIYHQPDGLEQRVAAAEADLAKENK